MATQNFTNQKDSQALRGEAVLVTLNGSDSANLYKLQVGQLATNTGNSKTGTIAKVDVYGHSFLINPIQPDKRFDSAPTVYGILSATETIQVTL
jgi:hypothetical protein